MKTATVTQYGIVNHITLQRNEKLERGVLVGATKADEYNGSTFVTIDKKFEDKIKDNLIKNCLVKKIQASSNKKKEAEYVYVLGHEEETKQQDSRILVMISTKGLYSKGSVGSIEILEGSPMILVEEKVQTVINSQSYAKEYLVIINPNDLIKIRWEGRGRLPDSVLTLIDDKLRIISWDEHIESSQVEIL